MRGEAGQRQITNRDTVVIVFYHHSSELFLVWKYALNISYKTAMVSVEVCSDRVRYSAEYIEAYYSYQTTAVKKEGNSMKCFPQTKDFVFRTSRKVPKTCLALVGWGGKLNTFS